MCTIFFEMPERSGRHGYYLSVTFAAKTHTLPGGADAEHSTSLQGMHRLRRQKRPPAETGYNPALAPARGVRALQPCTAPPLSTYP